MINSKIFTNEARIFVAWYSGLEWLPSTSAGGGWPVTCSGAGLDDLWTSPGAGLSLNIKKRRWLVNAISSLGRYWLNQMI
jgi:hypothetical protein